MLVSWKEIASFLDRAERTVKRWERRRGLPVHRVPGGERGSVFAYPAELQAWLNGEQGKAAQSAPEAEESLPEAERAELAPAGEGECSPADFQSLAATPPPRKRWSLVAPRGLASIAVAALIALVGGVALRMQRFDRGRAVAILAARQEPTSPRNPSSQAEEFYLQGRYQWSLRTAESLAKSIDFYTQAIVADPAYAQAYAGLAESYDLMPEYGDSDRAEYYQRAIAAAGKALELDPDLASAHRARAFALFYGNWDVTGSDAEFSRALALAPEKVESHHWYATTLFSRNESAKAIAEIDEALRLNPTNPSVVADNAFIHAFFNDHRENNMRTLRGLERSQPALLSPSRYLAELDLDDENYPEYLSDVGRSAAISHNLDEVTLAALASRGWALNGKEGVLQAVLKAEQASFARGDTSGYWLARAYLRLGDEKRAIQYFNEALRHNDYTLMTLPSCGCISPVKNEPEYAVLLAQIHARMYDRQILTRAFASSGLKDGYLSKPVKAISQSRSSDKRPF